MSRLAILEPLGLVAKELQERLEAEPLFCEELELFSTNEESIGTLTRVGGVAGMVRRFAPAALADTDVLFVCDGAAASGWDITTLPAGLGVVVLARDVPRLGLRSVVAGQHGAELRPDSQLRSPDAAVIGLAQLLEPLLDSGLDSAIATVLRPVSSTHSSALEEVFEQTRSLLNFQPIRRGEHFAQQIAFNILPATRDDADLVAELRSVLEIPGRVALQTLQAGVFHGLSMAVHCTMQAAVEIDVVREVMEASPRLLFADEPQGLGPIDTAAAEHVLVGALERAEPEGKGFWVWAVMDNLSVGGALNGIAVAKEMLGLG